MKRLGLVLSLFALLLTATLSAVATYSILKPDFKHKKARKAAYSISFDDKHIRSWYDARALFNKYDVKATFFITFPHELTGEEVEMLRALAADGHEIASHGYSHENAAGYVKKEGLDAYVAAEIVPSINVMGELGYHPVTFAYPYGARTRSIDLELKKYFFLLRGDSWKVEGKGINDLDRIFYSYDGSKVVNALGIDNGSNVTVAELTRGFIRARDRQEAIIIYAHSIDTSNTKYSITPERLESILAAAREQGLISVRFKDLVL